MAFLYTLEFDELEKDANGQVIQVAGVPALAQTRTDFNSATAGPTFNSRTRFVRVVADTACLLEFGGGEATAGSAVYLPANAYEYFAVQPSATLHVWDGTT